MRDPFWRDRAACRDRDPEFMFPLDDDVAGVERAKHICAGCPVRHACLTNALATMDHGVAGGLDHTERRALRRRATVDLAAAVAAVTLVPPTLPADACELTAQQLRAPRGKGRVRTSHKARPGYFAPAGVHVAADGIVTLDDATWARAADVLRTHLTARLAPDDQRTLITERHRANVAGMVHRYGHGIGWRSLPRIYGSPDTITKLHDALITHDRWADLRDALGIDDPTEPKRARGDRLRVDLVELVVTGQASRRQTKTLTAADREAVVLARWDDHDWQIAARALISERTVQRIRARLRDRQVPEKQAA